MTQMGPEALLLAAPSARRRELAEFTSLEYSRAESPRMCGFLLDEFEGMSRKRSVSREILRRGAQRLRRAGAKDAAAPSAPVAMAAECAAQARLGEATSLAALPVMGLGISDGQASPLSAIPILDLL